MAVTTIRRYTIHPPQLVGRISVPRPKEDVTQALRRLVGEYDGAMQELQRFLKYLQDANDTGQVGAGIVGVEAGEIRHPNVLDRDEGDAHPASAITNTPAGGISAATVQGALDELDLEKADFATVMMVADLGV